LTSDPSPATAEPATGLALLVRSARLSYRGDVLFDDLSVTLEGGLWTCVLGPSGVGKSSLLRLIAGLERAGGATVVSCSDGQPLAGRFAYMAQRDLLLPWLSAIDNVLFGYRLRGTVDRAARERAFALLRGVGLGGREHDRPAALSGGMRQRVALARTLMEDRPVVLMDEPFSALDAITRYRLQDLAAELLAGRTILLITHDPLEALRLGHRIHVMAGRPAALDQAMDLRSGATAGAAPPRDVAEPAVLKLQGELLHRLTAAADATAESAP
jgi:putative hydroxymethylpyrimidine transport system ATP-binding protein